VNGPGLVMAIAQSTYAQSEMVGAFEFVLDRNNALDDSVRKNIDISTVNSRSLGLFIDSKDFLVQRI
jgi:hypothetical protein